MLSSVFSSQYGNLLAVGSRLDDSKGISDSGITYLYQIETNGTATYLNKIYAPDMGGGDQFESRFPSRAIFLLSGHMLPIRGFPMPGRYILLTFPIIFPTKFLPT